MLAPIVKPDPPSLANKSQSAGPWTLLSNPLCEAGDPVFLPADRRTWIRRVYFDLIGLPPSTDEIKAFLDDSDPDAFDKVVDKLLVSPHFGEKWARHWMDLVRYAETCGHEFDYPMEHPHEYRDYLIRAFNDDLPYDQLLVEHVAGDLMDEPRLNAERKFNESIIGTGFWYFHEAVHTPTDPKQDNADRIENQLGVFGKTFLGLTIGSPVVTIINSMRFQTKITILWQPTCKEARAKNIPLISIESGKEPSGRLPNPVESSWMNCDRMLLSG